MLKLCSQGRQSLVCWLRIAVVMPFEPTTIHGEV